MSLADTVEDLRAEVRHLRSELGLSMEASDVDDLRALGLTPLEAKTVLCLYRAKGKVRSRFQITEAIGSDVEDASRLLAVLVVRIRHKMGDDFITTARGVGYRLTAAGVERVRGVLGEVFS